MTHYPWQQVQWQQLVRTYSQDRLSHAYLLSGISGLGKTDFANAFASLLLCKNPDKNTGFVCQQCKCCQLMRAKTHPDYIEITPHEKKHAIKIDQVRQLTQKLTQKSQYGGYQVVVISPADAMPVGAANALLKTLEEPLGDVVIFLVVDCMDQLPATIVSRCQQIYFYVNDTKKTLDWLINEFKTQTDIAALLSVAGGAPLAVKRLIDADYITLRDAVLKHLLAILTTSANPVSPIADWLKWDEDLIFYALISLAMDVARIQMGVHNDLMNADSQSLLTKIAQQLSPLALQLWLCILLDKKQLVARGMNLNSQLMFEDLLLKWGK